MKSNTTEEVLFDVGSLYERFENLSDSRDARGKRYRLATILVLMVLAKLCGEDKPSGIAEWAQLRAEELGELLQLVRQTMPHHSTYRRILKKVLAAEELDQLVSSYLTDRQYFGKQVLVAIDGKTLRGSLNDEQEGTYLLAAYLPAEGLVLMQVEIEGKGKEVPATLKLLKKLELRDKIVMGDALNTQREASSVIGAARGDYIWYAKGNQSQMETDIRLWFEPDPEPIPGQGCLPKDHESAKEVSKGHGRLEVRKITVSSQLKDFLDWPFLEQVFLLERQVTQLKTGAVSKKVIYGFTSLSREQVPPKKLLQLTRSYWGIENGLHYRRDVTLQEDHTRMTSKNMAHAMASLNNLILGILLWKCKFDYLPSARRYYAANLQEAFGLITQL